jgi:hypothetical protein
MAYNTKNLNVSSLDYTDIVSSLTTFLEVQPDLVGIDFRNTASAANMLINILATATAYNGAYSYFGFNESFKISAQNLESFSGLASNESILLPFTQSASTATTILASSSIPAYTAFSAKSLDGTNVLFFNIDTIPAGTNVYTLYCGSQIVNYTNYDYTGQYILLPLSIDPRTVRFIVTDLATNIQTTYSRVDRGSEVTTSGNYFTVINGPNGYIVTNNFINSSSIDLSKRVEVIAVTTNGSLGNNATITPLATTTFISLPSPSGGYDTINVERARSTVLFNGNGRRRWVTLNDLKYAIMSSGVSGTDDPDVITVSNGSSPYSVNVYVDAGLSASDQTSLLNFLSATGPAGITINYTL